MHYNRHTTALKPEHYYPLIIHQYKGYIDMMTPSGFYKMQCPYGYVAGAGSICVGD
jgi:hypothetical protein